MNEYQEEGRGSELLMDSVMLARDQPIAADALRVVEVTPVPAIPPDVLASMQSGVNQEPATSPKPASKKSAKATSNKDIPRPVWADVEFEDDEIIDE
eukprot:707685-Heterocapsa_arctica.AAC.1